ncbi:MAG: hypothetical protein ACRYGG_01860 [Janthinobacterium lividum]
MSNRDDFLKPVKRIVAARAGWQCSMCRRLTVGPSEEAPDALTNIGKAAHIAAASSGPGARRYDDTMTPKERAGIANAIWLCSDHAELIDRDAVTYSASQLHNIKRNHEQLIAHAVRIGTSTNFTTGLFAIGPDIVCTGVLASVSADSWRLRLAHFLTGDIHKITMFIDGFVKMIPEDQYVLSNDVGDGRVLTSAPTLVKEVDDYILICPVAASFPRIDAQKLGSSMALHPDTSDLYVDSQGDIARVSGLDYLPQKIHMLLSLNQGDNVFSPKYGMRFFEYFEAFRGSPWLDLMLKLDVIRQASIPFYDRIMSRHETPLRCVNRVHSIDLLTDSPVDNRLSLRISLDVQGVGKWIRELSIFMPTPDQVATRARLRADIF